MPDFATHYFQPIMQTPSLLSFFGIVATRKTTFSKQLQLFNNANCCLLSLPI